MILLQCQLQSFVQLCDPMDYSTPGFPVLHYIWRLLSLMSIESVLPSNHIILCHPLLFCLQSFPASGSLPVSQLFTSGGQSIRASVSVLPMNIQGWFPWELTSSTSWKSKRLLRVFLSTIVQKHQFFGIQPSLCSKSQICTCLLEKPFICLYGPLSAKWHLCFLMLIDLS